MKKTLIGTAFGIVAATAAQATPISIQEFSFAAFNDATANALAIEDFEDASTLLTPAGFRDGGQVSTDGLNRTFGEINDTIVSSSVGSFSTIANPGVGTGSTCRSLSGGLGNCDNIALQFDPALNGQGNILPEPGQYALNSNDTLGLSWVAELAGGGLFNQLVFALRDAADNKATLTVDTGTASASFSNLGNNNEQLFVVDLGALVSSATITLSNSRINDGFTFDGAAITVAPVPLPAAAWMLLAGLGGMALLRRRANV
ncbi:VPLPA-CTERM sorting domain-containing protein [Gymnodinialimonas sp. 2305UL16-5]|uniref:VPLPA-CTERM sorting domain-containing protein n=1 Tax=Gymnodinialimonas mytili TaxID=3126503 RepID=UPI0030B674E5